MQVGPSAEVIARRQAQGTPVAGTRAARAATDGTDGMSFGPRR